MPKATTALNTKTTNTDHNYFESANMRSYRGAGQ